MIIVYHLDSTKCDSNPHVRELLRDIMFSPTQDSILKALHSSLYKKVAEVETNRLDTAYELTNSIESHWSENIGVIQFGERNKSSSVGDLLVSEGKLFAVDSTGFTELPKEFIGILPMEYKPNRLKM